MAICLSSVFSPDGTLISASAAPYCGVAASARGVAKYTLCSCKSILAAANACRFDSGIVATTATDTTRPGSQPSRFHKYSWPPAEAASLDPENVNVAEHSPSTRCLQSINVWQRRSSKCKHIKHENKYIDIIFVYIVKSLMSIVVLLVLFLVLFALSSSSCFRFLLLLFFCFLSCSYFTCSWWLVKLVSSLVLWAQSTTKDYIRAEHKLHAIS